MQYTQSMTDLVFAIRARLSCTYKHSIKTSNPELLGDLAEIYHETLDATLRSHIEQLMALAGVTWVALLTKPANVKPTIKLYKHLIPALEQPSRGAVA